MDDLDLIDKLRAMKLEIESSKKAKENLKNRSEFTRGLARGIDSMQATYEGAGGMISSALGDETTARTQFLKYQDQMRQASENPATVDKFFSTDEKTGALASPGNFGAWAAGTAGAAVPSIAESVLTGIAGAAVGGAAIPAPDPADVATVPLGFIGGVVGKGYAKKKIAEFAAQYVAKGMTREAAENAATQAFRNSVAKQVGAGVATSQVTAAHEGGGMWAKGMESGVDNPLSAMALGQVSGTSEAAFGVVPAAVRSFVGRTGAQAVAREFGPKVAAGYVWDLMKNTGKEGLQESFQEFLGSINENINDPSKKVLTRENFMQWAEAGAAGALVGSLFSAGEVATSAYGDIYGEKQADPGMESVKQYQPTDIPVDSVGPSQVAAPQDRLSALQTIVSKGFVSEEDATAAGIAGASRKERLANAKAEIAQLEAAASQATESEVVPPEEQDVPEEQVDVPEQSNEEKSKQFEEKLIAEQAEQEKRRKVMEEMAKARASIEQPAAAEVESTVPEVKQPKAISADQISNMFGEAVKGISDGLHDKVWNDAQSGSLEKMSKPPLFEQLVLRGYKAGVVKSVEDVKSISEGFTGDFATDKNVGVDNLNKLVEKYKNQSTKTVPVSNDTAEPAKVESAPKEDQKPQVTSSDKPVEQLPFLTPEWRAKRKKEIAERPGAVVPNGPKQAAAIDEKIESQIDKEIEMLVKYPPGTQLMVGSYEEVQTVLPDGTLHDASGRGYNGNAGTVLMNYKPEEIRVISKPKSESAKNPPVEEVKQTPSWVKYDDSSYGVKISDPATGSAEATLSYSGDEASIYVDVFASGKDAPKGSGKKLLRSIADSAKEYSPKSISGHFTNTAALGAFGSEFGQENVTFKNKKTGQAESISFEQAMQSPEKYIATADISGNKPTEKVPPVPEQQTKSEEDQEYEEIEKESRRHGAIQHFKDILRDAGFSGELTPETVYPLIDKAERESKASRVDDGKNWDDIRQEAERQLKQQVDLNNALARKPSDYDNLPEATRTKFESAWNGSDPSSMIPLIHSGNKTLRAEFENRSGKKLPKTVKGTKEVVDSFYSERSASKPENKPAAQEGSIGLNSNGEPVFEDKNGVRSVASGDVRIEETVSVRPTRGPNGKITYVPGVDKENRDSRFKTTSEVESQSSGAVSGESQQTQEVKDAPQAKKGGDPNEVQTKDGRKGQANAETETQTKGQVGSKEGQVTDKSPSPDSSIRKAIEENGGYENNSADDVEAIRRKLYDGPNTPSHADIRAVMQAMKTEGSISIDEFAAIFANPESAGKKKSKEPKAENKTNPVEFSEIKNHAKGVKRTIRAKLGDTTLLLEESKSYGMWSIRKDGTSNDIADDINDLKKAKSVAQRILAGTFDPEGDLRFVQTDNTNIAYSNEKLADLWSISTVRSFYATLKQTGYYTDGRVLFKVNDKDRDAILNSAGSVEEGRVLAIDNIAATSKVLIQDKDNEASPVGYRGGDIADRTVAIKNKQNGIAIVDKKLHDTILKKHPKAKIWSAGSRFKAERKPVTYTVDGEIVGILMPLEVRRVDSHLQSLLNDTYVFAQPKEKVKPKSVRKDVKKGIEEGLKEAKDGADLILKGLRDLGNTGFSGPPINRDIAVGLGMMANGLIKAGKYKFIEFVDEAVNLLGAPAVKYLGPYLEAGWNKKAETDDRLDRAVSISDYLFGEEDGRQIYDEGDGADQEGAGGSDINSNQPGSAAAASALEEAQSADGKKTRATRDTGGIRDGNAGSIQQGSGATDGNVEDGNVGSATGESGDLAVGSGDKGFSRPGDGSGIDLAPKSSRPNFHLTDPNAIVGRGLKDKFSRNVRALELSQDLDESGRPPTQEELEILASYIGWGAFGQELFQGNWNTPKVKKDWESENEWLREHLGEEEWRSAQESIPNAHYTDPEVVSGIWSMIEKMGFKGGRFLEPSFGVGNFAALMPREIMSRTSFTAIELDKATARIAKILYPQINVQQKGYQDSKTPNDFYDVIATNVPFGDYKIVDRMYRMPYSIHNYFFRKAIDQTKPGGLMAFVTSNMTMDGKEEAKLLRKQLSDRGDLIAAFRFPTGAFERYAKTKVVADLIIIRKRKPGETPSPLNSEWIEIVDVDTPSGTKVAVNEYWTKHPENILGTLNHGHGTTNGRPGMIVDKPANLEDLWRKAVDSVPQGILNTDRKPSEGKERANERKLRQNTVVNKDGDLYIAKGEQLIPLKEYVNWYRANSKEATIKKIRDEIISLLKVRDSLERVLEVQGKGEDASKERSDLNKNYDAFVAKYGPITTSKAIGHLRDSGDAIANAVASLESRNANGEYEKRPVFNRTTVRQAPRIGEKLKPVDAFALARNNSVDIDWDSVAKSAQMPKKEVLGSLEKDGLIYKTGDDSYEAADVFLSGNMARKLRQLEAAKNEGVLGLEKSIAAAKAAMPEPLVYNQIQVSLGAPWVTAGDYSQFFADLLSESVENTQIVKAVRGWKVQFSTSANRSPAVVTHGHAEVTFSKMVAAAMNNGRVTVFYKDAEGNPHKDEEATLEANAKIDELKDKFRDWIWQSPDRIARLSQAYNEDHRSIVTPDWKNINVPLLFEGLALQRGDDPFSLRKHQETAVWRAIVSGKGLFAHEVGTGKTLTMASIAIESRRLRLANKPVIFAHNANSQAVYREAQDAYPGAKILYVDNLDAKNKGQAMASIATEDWDLIVIPHSLVDNLKLRPETLEKLLQEQMDQLEAAALEAFNEDDSPFKGSMPSDLDNIDESQMKKLKQRTAKELVKERLRLRERIRAAQADAANESTIFIEDMGIDMLLVDEAHIFKKIPLATRQQVKGLNKRASDIGNSLLLLSDYIRGTQNGRGIYLFTGTPITNTLNEIYNMQRFIMPDEMQAVGVKDWDGWFNTFATSETSDELSAGGTYEEFERLTSFVNLPELRSSIGQYMDTVFASDMPEFIPRPSRVGRVEEGDPIIGRPYKEVHNETLQMMPIQKRLSEDLKRRYRELRDAKGRAKFEMMRTREYMPLMINTDGVKLALDPRLIDGVDARQIDPRDSRLKVNKMLLNAMEYYHSHPKATQMIFMEMGHDDTATRTVGRDNDGKPIKERVKVFNLAKEIKRRLMEEGVPESEIAIFSAMTKEKRAEAARAMNRGEIRFAIGGTETLGTGINAQENLIAMHHLDAPWMPGALEQRNGRGLRQGNRWNTVHEHRYLTEGPQDGRRWQVLLTKDRFIYRFMHHQGDERVIDMSDVDMDEEGQGDFESTFSAAVGDPRIQQRFRLEREINKLIQAKDRHHKTIQNSLWEAHRQETQDIPRLQSRMQTYMDIQKKYQESRQEKTDQDQSPEPVLTLSDSVKIPDKTVVGAEDISNALEYIAGYFSLKEGTKRKVGEYRGVDVLVGKSALGSDILFVGDLNLEIKPSFASMDGILRNLGKRIESIQADVEKKQSFVKSANESAKLPFVRQQQLDAKQKKLKSLVAEIEANPEGSPFWFRNMAPIGSSIYTRKRKKAPGALAFMDMESEMHRERITGESAAQNVQYEFEEHAVSGYRSDTHVLYEENSETVAVPVSKVFDENGNLVFEDIEDLRNLNDSSPDLTKAIDSLPPTLYQSDDVDAAIRGQAVNIAILAEKAGINTFEKLVAYSIKKLGEYRTREIGDYLRLAADVAGFKGVRSTDDVLGVPGTTREQFFESAKLAFPKLSDSQIDSVVSILDGIAFGWQKIGFAPFGSPAPDRIASQTDGRKIKGWTSFLSPNRAIIGATDRADFSTFVHEIFHPVRRFLLDRSIPQDQREGITDEDILALEKYAGVKDGKWQDNVDAEEKAAKAWEQYWFEGKAPAGLEGLFRKIARWMHSVYKTAMQITGEQSLPAEVRALFDKLVQRGGTEIQTVLGDNEFTSTKKDEVTELRIGRGLPALADVPSQTQQEWLDAAQDRLQANNMLGDQLVKEINSNPRTLNNVEVAVLQLYYRHVNNQLEESSEKLFTADKEKNVVAKAQAQVQVDYVMNVLHEIEEAARKAGREWGRAGVAQQIVLAKDFSPAAMMRKARIANMGNELSAEQKIEIAELARKVADLEGQLAEANQAKLDAERQRLVDAVIENDKDKEPRVPRAIRQKAIDRLSAFTKKFASVFGPGGKDAESLFATEDEQMIDDAMDVVKAYVEIGVFTFGEFLANVRKDLGQDIPMAAKTAFAAAWAEANDNGEIPVPMVDRNNLRGITVIARQIERTLVEGGLRDRDEIVKFVNEALLEFIPDITIRETMDALSMYGQYTPLSDNEIDVIIRDINGQLQQLAKLDDMRKGKAPSKTGVERREISDDERRLIAQVNEAKRQGGFTVADPARHLKTMMQAAKTAVTNRIKDLQYEIDKKQKIVRTKTELKPDEELIALRKQRDELMKIHKEMFPRPGMTDEKKIEIANRALNKVLADLEEEFRTGKFSRNTPSAPISTPELDAKRARIAALREQKNAILGVREKTPEQLEKMYKASLLNRIADYKERAANKEFEPRRKEVRVLSDSELTLKKELKDAKDLFYRKAAEYRLENMSPLERSWDYAKETAHLARAIMTSGDLSAVFRQGGVASLGNPKLALGAALEMWGAIWSEKSEFATAESIRNDKMYQFAMTAGLSITEDEAAITRQEEAFSGRWARHGIGKEGSGINRATKVVLSPVSASARAYSTFLNGIRFRLFKKMVNDLGRGGQVTSDEAKVIAHYINVATGRGDLGKFSQAAASMSVVFFAPRYVVSRLQFMAMPFYVLPSSKVSGRVKKAIAMEYAKYAIGLTTFIGLTTALGSVLAFLAGDDEEEYPTFETDPRSTDFMKIKLGDTRIDPMSGFSQVITFISQVGLGQKKTQDGDVIDLRGENHKKGTNDTWDSITDFVRKKLAPIPGAVVDAFVGENVVHQPRTPLTAVTHLFIPIAISEVISAMQTNDIPKGAAVSILAILGMGGGTYGTKTRFMTASETEREELFKNDLKRMQWDSPNPPYSEMLTKEQMEQVVQRREERRQDLVYAATSDPVRSNYRNDETYEQALKERDEALAAIRGAGWTKDQVHDLLLGYWKANYGATSEVKAGRMKIKDAVLRRLMKINRDFNPVVTP